MAIWLQTDIFFDTFDRMDTQFWIWLIIVVITLLARGLKKKSPPERRRSESYDDHEQESSQPSTQPMSFEDLLREIQASKAPRQPEPAPKSIPEPQTQYVDYDDDIAEEEQDLEKVDYDYKKEDNIYQVYEDAKNQAFMRPSMEEENSNLSSKAITFEHFKRYDVQQKGPTFDFLAELKDPEGFKKAFIMSEILSRKYWKGHFLG